MDCGFYYAKTGGLFSNFTPEGVSADVGRRSRNGRPRTDGREREKGADGEQGLPRRLSIAGGEELSVVVG